MSPKISTAAGAPELVAVALPVPLYKTFDYRVPEALQAGLRAGMRVRVPFGRRQLVGVVAQPPREAPDGGLEHRPLEAALDAAPLLPADVVALCRWAADYYHHPVGEVFATALPGPLRRGDPAEHAPAQTLGLTEAGRAALASLPARQRALRGLLERLAAGAEPGAATAAVRRRALERGWVEWRANALAAPAGEAPPVLTAEQAEVLAALAGDAPGFGVTLLEGVTGSGKTEIYLRRIAEVLARGAQALVLVPEIGLTPQLVERFARRFPGRVGSFHSGLSESERTRTWLRARAGELAVVIGTRSAVWLPFRELGLIVIDEEHDVSYKQQDGLRYSARDLAVVRAQRLDVAVILGTATPSLESLHNVRGGRYRHRRLTQRVQSAAPPRVQLVDVRGQALAHGLSTALLDAIERHLAAERQALLFINRRGYAPVLLCHACGWSAPCTQCNAHLTLHRGRARLVCHHCGAQAPVPAGCPSCAARPLLPVGQGTERIEDALKNRFPRHRVERFDSDRLRRAGELERLLDDIRARRIHILVGTQILAKGHDFDGVSLVGIVSADQALYGSDFRALERMGQLVTQVAGRAGRAGAPGEVLMQTHEPQHPLLRTLVEGGYGALCTALLAERELAGLPPFGHLALLRAEAPAEALALRWLAQARAALPARAGVMVSDAVPAPMEKRGGLFRAQLLLQAAQRSLLHRLLAEWVPQLAAQRGARPVRWSLDVDPADLF